MLRKILILSLIAVLSCPAFSMMKILNRGEATHPAVEPVAVAAVAEAREPAAAPAVKTPAKKLLIDDFESGSLKKPRDWWTFDLQKVKVNSNDGLTKGDKSVAQQVGKYSLQLAGRTTDWYAGGCGTYLAQEGKDLSSYDAVQLDIFGYGPGSGTLKIELVDDDNRNWQTEQDPKKNYALTSDDKFVYDVKVDWSGWQRVTAPFADFYDDNEGVGDDVWNPQSKSGSGGLLQMQFICLGAKAKSDVQFSVDNVSLSAGGK